MDSHLLLPTLGVDIIQYFVSLTILLRALVSLSVPFRNHVSSHECQFYCMSLCSFPYLVTADYFILQFTRSLIVRCWKSGDSAMQFQPIILRQNSTYLNICLFLMDHKSQKGKSLF